MAKTPSERQAEGALPTPASAVESDILGEGECREIVVCHQKTTHLTIRRCIRGLPRR